VDLQDIEGKSAAEILQWALRTYGNRFAIATSFQKSGMVVLDLAARTGLPFRVFTLDTGRLPEETSCMVDAVRERYGVRVELVSPDPSEVRAMVRQHGPDLFYDGVEFRKLCCEVRKVRPLARKLGELDAWATGLRRDQAETRAAVAKAAIVDGRVKISPLADWTAAEVEEYIRAHDVPVHPLYARGYKSIGCAPCTRPVMPGEGDRAGRWWWEQEARKECGIHFAPDGSVERAGPRRDMHKGFTIWFTGLSGAGKSTISGLLEARLRALGAKVEVLDGDVVRTHLSKGLGFSKEDRDENIRRIGFVCRLLSRNGVIAIAAAISPYRAIREEVRRTIENFVEVYIECPLEVLAERDVKGLYKKALAGEISQFTGVSDPYEPPVDPEVTVNSAREKPEESVDRIWATLEGLGLVSFDRSSFAHQ